MRDRKCYGFLSYGQKLKNPQLCLRERNLCKDILHLIEKHTGIYDGSQDLH